MQSAVCFAAAAASVHCFPTLFFSFFVFCACNPPPTSSSVPGATWISGTSDPSPCIWKASARTTGSSSRSDSAAIYSVPRTFAPSPVASVRSRALSTRLPGTSPQMVVLARPSAKAANCSQGVRTKKRGDARVRTSCPSRCAPVSGFMVPKLNSEKLPRTSRQTGVSSVLALPWKVCDCTDQWSELLVAENETTSPLGPARTATSIVAIGVGKVFACATNCKVQVSGAQIWTSNGSPEHAIVSGIVWVAKSSVPFRFWSRCAFFYLESSITHSDL